MSQHNIFSSSEPLMKEITGLVEKYVDPLRYINSSDLHDSGTGYIYPSLCDELVTKFIDQYGRKGFMFQTMVTNLKDSSSKRSSFLVHARYTGDDSNVVYSGLDEFYYNCCVRSENADKFLKRLESLLKGETVGNWNEICNEEYGEKPFLFKLSVDEIKKVEQRPFLVVVDSMV